MSGTSPAVPRSLSDFQALVTRRGYWVCRVGRFHVSAARSSSIAGAAALQLVGDLLERDVATTPPIALASLLRPRGRPTAGRSSRRTP